MHRVLVRTAAALALLAMGLAVGPPAAAQGSEPMYNITRWGDYTIVTAVVDSGGYSVWPNEFYHQFDCGADGGFIGLSVMLDDPMTGDLSYMTDPSTTTIRWVAYDTATGPSGGTYMVVTAATDTNGCNWPAKGTVLTQWYQGENFDRQPDITNRAIDPAWFVDAGKNPPTDPAEFWGTNLDNTGWGLTTDTPPVIIDGGSDSGFGPIAIMETVDAGATDSSTTSSTTTTPSTTQTTETPNSAPSPSVTASAGGSASGSGAAGAGGGGGGGGNAIIGIIILVLAAFLMAGGSLAWMRKKRVGLWSMTREMGKLVTQLPPNQKQELVQGFRDTHNKADYIDYLKGLRDYNLGFTDQPPTPPKPPVKNS